MSTSLIPTIDVSGWAEGSSARRSEIATAVDEAYRTVGFLQIDGHGVSPSLIADMQAVTTEFFDLPVDEKLATVGWNRGYTAPGQEALSYSAGFETPPDLFQAFNAGAQIHTVDPATRPERHAGLFRPNVWPDVPARMQVVWEDYMATVAALGRRMLGIMSVALGLDESYFPERTDNAPDVLRALDYRSFGDAPPVDGQMRLGAHSDYGTCTLLYADPVPGLQLLGSNGAWHDVTPEPGRFLVNVGDMVASWTNDRWRSTIHRVVPARPGESMVRRSMAYFCEANPDAIIEPLPSCVDDEHPPRYEPISAGDNLLAKLSTVRAMETTDDTIQTAGDRAAALLATPTND